MRENARNSIKTILERDVVFLAILTGLSYYFVYTFQKQYLGYFGISEVFIETSTIKVLSTAAAVAGSGVILYHFSMLIPRGIIRPILENLLYWILHVLLAIFTFSFFYFSGFTWLSIISIFILSVISIISIILLIKKLKSGQTYQSILNNQIEIEIENRDVMLGIKVLDKVADKLGPLIYSFMLFSLLTGGLFGSLSAAAKRDYQSFSFEGENYVVIQRFSEGIVAVSYRTDAEETKKAILLGSAIYLEIRTISGISFLLLDNYQIIAEPKSEKSWTTLSEFWFTNFGKEDPIIIDNP